jgi:hypothetical protein
MLVVGDDDGKIIWGITVNFEEDLLESYGIILYAIYKFAYEFAYTCSSDHELPENDSCLEQALNSLCIEKEEFEQQFKMWCFVGQCLNTPIPPVVRIVPFWVAVWNAMKSGSDTYSYLLAQIGFHVPEESSQAHIVGHFLKLIAAVMHRCYQKLTAKKTVAEVGSLFRYRKNAANRASYKQSVKYLAQALLRSFSPVAVMLDSNLDGTIDSSLCTTPDHDRRRSTRSTTQLQLLPGTVTTGLTPLRNVSRQYDRDDTGQNAIELGVKQRFRGCCGLLLERVNPDLLTDGSANKQVNGGRGSCEVCGARTPWFCVLCHHHYCAPMTAKRLKLCGAVDNQNAPPGSQQKYIAFGEKDGAVVVHNNCFLIHHKEAIVAMVDDQRRNLVANLDKKNSENVEQPYYRKCVD